MGAQYTVQVVGGSARFYLGGLIKLDLRYLDAGEAEGSGVGECPGESGGVDRGDVQTILYY
jgi:hypothetical protein